MSRSRWIGLAVVLGLPISELGHTVATALRAAPQDSGGHMVAPVFLVVAVALLAIPAAAVVALLLAAGGRLKRRPVISVLELAVTLLSVQLLAYLLQEAMEASAMHAGLSGATVLFGLAGQAPVAFLAAAVLAWIAARLAPALETLADGTQAARPQGVLILVRTAAPAAEPAGIRLGLSLASRAPPLFPFDQL